MMLINPEAIKAHPISQFELIKVIVVEPVAELGIIQITRDINPDTSVLFLEIFGQEAVGHQMKPGKLHDASPLGISFKLRAPRPDSHVEKQRASPALIYDIPEWHN